MVALVEIYMQFIDSLPTACKKTFIDSDVVRENLRIF